MKTFLKGISPKVNVIVRSVFELIFFDVVIKQVSHNAMGSSPSWLSKLTFKKITTKLISMQIYEDIHNYLVQARDFNWFEQHVKQSRVILCLEVRESHCTFIYTFFVLLFLKSFFFCCRCCFCFGFGFLLFCLFLAGVCFFYFVFRGFFCLFVCLFFVVVFCIRCFRISNLMYLVWFSLTWLGFLVLTAYQHSWVI